MFLYQTKMQEKKEAPKTTLPPKNVPETPLPGKKCSLHFCGTSLQGLQSS